MRRESGRAGLLTIAVAAFLASGLLLTPGMGRANVTILPPTTIDVTRNIPSTATITVSPRSGSQIVYRVVLQFSSTAYQASSVTPPTGWQLVRSGAGALEFEATNCSAGLNYPNSGAFVISVTTPRTGNVDTSAEIIGTATGYSRQAVGSCRDGQDKHGQANITANVKSFYLFGATLSSDSTATTQTVTWTVANQSGPLAHGDITVSPSDATGTCDPPVPTSIPQYTTATVTCRYPIGVGQVHSLVARAVSADKTVFSLPATPSTITWTKSGIVQGRRPYTLGLTVLNESQQAITEADLDNSTKTGWVPSGGSPASGALSYSSSSNASRIIFNGAPSLASAASRDLGVTLGSVPAAPATTSFTVTLSWLIGATTYSVTTDAHPVSVVTSPPSNVSKLTLLNSPTIGRRLKWVNATDQAGVVVFSNANPNLLPTPTDFRTYTAGSGGVVCVGAGTSCDDPDRSRVDVAYRVCGYDANHVYADCADEDPLVSELYPQGGWVHAVGGQALVRAGLLAGNRIGQATNAPTVVVLDLATGDRAFDPVDIPELPTIYTPAFALSTPVPAAPPPAPPTRYLFAADHGGHVSAVNMDSGARMWTFDRSAAVPKEDFTAGVSGVTLSGASSNFAYGTDVLFIGSASSGNVYAIDAMTGADLWPGAPVKAGTAVNGLIAYDRTNNFIYVPTGSGIKVYNLTGTGPGVPPTTAVDWKDATTPSFATTGDFRSCLLTAYSRAMACINYNGQFGVMAKNSGRLLANVVDTVSQPTSMARIAGTWGEGFVVSNTSQAVVLKMTWNATTSTYTITKTPLWPATANANYKLSPPLVRPDIATGDTDAYYFVAVGGSAGDLSLHRISLTSGMEVGNASPPIKTRLTFMDVAQPIYDATSSRFLFGTEDGHVWAIPKWF